MTKRFKVFHTRNWGLNTKLHFDTDGYVPVKLNYNLVAVVACEKLADTFYFTNHVNEAWFDFPNVEVVRESRSTSVGDLVEDENGQLYLCAGRGWEKVEWNNDDLNDLVLYKDEYGEFVTSKKSLLEAGNDLEEEIGNKYHLKEEADMQNELYRKEIF